ncbi:MAG: phosphoribosylaminoimidazolesuccinocarboxamide synthase [Acidobacteriaceae bacterium]|nr:phosphoribosylaminoimidazolesuccinocarboxamide synthase [Acidobacteriaceae bacterium]
MQTSSLPLTTLRRGKVRDVYEIDHERVLLVATDRVSAFDVVMNETIPHKGAVLTQITAWWLRHLEDRVAHHMISADAAEIVQQVPQLRDHEAELAGRAMLCRRTTVFPIECVVRGYISGSAWKEYREHGTLAGEPLPKGLRESDRLDPPIFSPATKAEEGHDENITIARMRSIVGEPAGRELERLSREIYGAGREIAARRGIIIADTKFEFGRTPAGIVLADEVLTPDSSRFWPAETYKPGQPQESFDKQYVRDYLESIRWNKQPPAPALPPEVALKTSEKYREAYRRLTGHELPV